MRGPVGGQARVLRTSVSGLVDSRPMCDVASGPLLMLCAAWRPASCLSRMCVSRERRADADRRRGSVDKQPNCYTIRSDSRVAAHAPTPTRPLNSSHSRFSVFSTSYETRPYPYCAVQAYSTRASRPALRGDTVPDGSRLLACPPSLSARPGFAAFRRRFEARCDSKRRRVLRERGL